MSADRFAEDTRQLDRWRATQTTAKALWRIATTPRRQTLRRAGLPANCGIREQSGRLLVPMRDADGELWALQYLWPEDRPARPKLPGGEPAYMPNARLRGLQHHVGGGIGESVAVVLHLADAVMLREEEGVPAVIAFTPENLAIVAAELRERHPLARVVCWSAREEESAQVRAAAETAGVAWAEPGAIGLIFAPPESAP